MSQKEIRFPTRDDTHEELARHQAAQSAERAEEDAAFEGLDDFMLIGSGCNEPRMRCGWDDAD